MDKLFNIYNFRKNVIFKIYKKNIKNIIILLKGIFDYKKVLDKIEDFQLMLQ